MSNNSPPRSVSSLAFSVGSIFLQGADFSMCHFRIVTECASTGFLEIACGVFFLCTIVSDLELFDASSRGFVDALTDVVDPLPTRFRVVPLLARSIFDSNRPEASSSGSKARIFDAKKHQKLTDDVIKLCLLLRDCREYRSVN